MRIKTWNIWYEQTSSVLSRQVFMSRILASARVFERDIKEQFEEQNSTVEVRYIRVEPTVEPTEEEVREQYDLSPERYRDPDERVVEFVTYSLVPGEPEAAADVVQRARDGEDFAALATEFSDGPLASSGGDLGWVPLDDNIGPARAPLADLAVGRR